MTEKENYLRVLNGEKPEWVPNYRDACDWVVPYFQSSYMETEEKIDFVGVHWIVNESGAMADTGNLPLDDIANWRDVVHLPDPDTFDWETWSKKDLASHDPDKAIAIPLGLGGGCFFIPLVNMMGFEEGLCAMIIDEDEVKALFEHFMDWYERYIPKLIEYYHPDVLIVGDDICSATSQFVTMDTYETLLEPLYRRCGELIHAGGAKYEFHMCGKCEVFIHRLMELGIDIWQPAQPLNDLKALKEQYGRRLVMNGGWHSSGPGGVPNAPEEVVRQSARDTIDLCAPGGGYVFWNGDPVGNSEDMLQKMAWLDDEARTYGREYYKTHP